MKGGKMGISFMLSAILLCLLWYFYPLISNFIFPNIIQDDVVDSLAKFGDMYGGLNAFLSALAVLGLIYTIRLQSTEIKDSREASDHQSRSLLLQGFESSLLSLVEINRDLVSSIRLKSGLGGIEALLFVFEDMKISNDHFPAFVFLKKVDREGLIAMKTSTDLQPWEKVLGISGVSTISSLPDKMRTIDIFLDGDEEMHFEMLKKECVKVAGKYYDELSHYIKSLSFVFSFVGNSSVLSEEDRKRYYSLVKSQVSDIEIVVYIYFYVASRCGEFSIPVFDGDCVEVISGSGMLDGLSDGYFFHKSHLSAIKRGVFNV